MPPSAAWNTQRQTERARTPKASAREECLEKTQAECKMSAHGGRRDGAMQRVCREMIAPLMSQDASVFVLAPDEIVLFFRGDDRAAAQRGLMGRRREAVRVGVVASHHDFDRGKTKQRQKRGRCRRKKEGKGWLEWSHIFVTLTGGEADINASTTDCWLFIANAQREIVSFAIVHQGASLYSVTAKRHKAKKGRIDVWKGGEWGK